VFQSPSFGLGRPCRRTGEPHEAAFGLFEDACLIEAVRSANKTIDIDNVNRVLMQPHWQKETDLVDY